MTESRFICYLSFTMLIHFLFWLGIACLAALVGCGPSHIGVATEKGTEPQGTPIIVEGSRGFAYEVSKADDEDGDYEDVEPGPRIPGSDLFTGKDRAHAKVTPSDGPLTEYQSLKPLLDSLVSDAEMKTRITVKDEWRVAAEEFNAKVPCFLAATKEEADHDFHCILTDGKGNYMTAEVSGLPAQDATGFIVLHSVRDVFKHAPFFKHVSTDHYIILKPPMPVVVAGSLFFDVDHPAGAIGPRGMQPKTAWEIHPVTSIEFEP